MRNSMGVPVGVALCGLVLAGASLASDSEPKPSESLTIVDLDGRRVSLTPQELRAMAQAGEEQCICVGKKSGFMGIFNFSGVRLAEVLTRAKAAQAASGYRKENLYVVFRGTDGYQVIASWTELMDTDEGRRALIALDKDGAPLPASEGNFRLVLPGDKYVGRSVRCLETIEVRCADGVEERKED